MNKEDLINKSVRDILTACDCSSNELLSLKKKFLANVLEVIWIHGKVEGIKEVINERTRIKN